MKYIKTYEKIVNKDIDVDVDKIWKVPSKKPDFIIALNKIGVPQSIASWLDDKCKYFKDDIVIFRTKIKKHDFFYWTWAPLRPEENMLDYYKKCYNYQGEVEVTPEEIEFWNTTNKYNL